MLSKLFDLGGFFGADIGGTLCKLVFFLPDKELATRMLQRAAPERAAQSQWASKLESIQKIAGFIFSRTHYGATGVRDDHLSFRLEALGGSFHFIRFETRRFEGALQLAQRHGLNAGMERICATGGGAHKFRDAAREILGVELVSRDEIDCLVKGMAYLMAHISAETYTWVGDLPQDRPMDAGIKYPYLLVNVGSGVSFILVRSEHSWERVSGTSLGGGTFFGLSNLITGETSFDRMLDSAEGGNNANVDLTVGDIYGGDYQKFGLKANTIAATFGKPVSWVRESVGGDGSQHVSVPTRERSITESDLAGGDADGSFSGLGRVSIKRGDALQLPTPPRQKLAEVDDVAVEAPPLGGLAVPLVHRSWDPATVLAAAAASPVDAAIKPSDSVAPSQERASLPPRTHRSSPFSRSSPPETSLPPDSTAASGDRIGPCNAESGVSWEPRDAHRSLLIMISNNIGQLAYLNALQHKCQHIYFAGNFLRVENTIAMRTLAYAISYWSKGTMEGLFLRHEGYCGALGAFLSTLEA